MGISVWRIVIDREEWLKEWLHFKYWEQGLSATQIAPLVGKCHKTVLKWMRKYGIPLRTVSQAAMGKRHSAETRRKISEAKKGKKNPMWGRTGKKHPRWKGGKTRHRENYVVLLRPEHPAADPHGHILEHRLVMADHLGRDLKPGEVVHHVDGDGLNNHIDNLMLFPSQSEHRRYHLSLEDT